MLSFCDKLLKGAQLEIDFQPLLCHVEHLRTSYDAGRIPQFYRRLTVGQEQETESRRSSHLFRHVEIHVE